MRMCLQATASPRYPHHPPVANAKKPSGVVWSDAKVEVVLEWDTDEIGDRILGFLGQFLGLGVLVADRFGGVCGTGLGEAFIRLGLARLMVVELQHGMDAAAVAKGAIDHLGKALKAPGGVIVIGREGSPQAAFNTPAMPWAIAE